MRTLSEMKMECGKGADGGQHCAVRMVGLIYSKGQYLGVWDITAQRSFPGQWLPFLAPFEAVFNTFLTPFAPNRPRDRQPQCLWYVQSNATKSAPLTYSPFHH